MKLDKDSKLMRKGEQNDIKWAQINWENKKEDKKNQTKQKRNMLQPSVIYTQTTVKTIKLSVQKSTCY